MADYKIPNLCGASVQFNALQSIFDDMINTAASPAGLIADAKALATSLEPNVTSLLDEVKNILPELPALPEVNLQAELTSLSGLSAGSFEHGTLLAEITTKFGSGLTAGGYSIDTLVDTALDAVAGLGDVDMCGGVPNFTIPAAGGTAIEKAVGVKQADVNSLVEEASSLIANVNFFLVARSRRVSPILPDLTSGLLCASPSCMLLWVNSPPDLNLLPCMSVAVLSPS